MSVPADARPGSPEPTVDDLTNWFLAAKRSLSSVTLCQQANILVDTAKAAIQEAAAISARCVFLRNSLQDQLNIAGQVSRMVQSRQDQLRGEFQKTLAELDTADSRLNATLALLRESIVDPAFNADDDSKDGASEDNNHERANGHDGDWPSSSDASRSSSPQARERTLHDFVDDEAIEDLKSRLRGSIDSVQESHDDLASYHASFSESLTALTSALQEFPDPASIQSTMASFSPILAFLEDRTEHMGGLLESLTTHYDLCQSTLRQLESHLPLSSPDILPVLSRDAKIVDDVVLDLQESFSKVEAASQDLQDTMSHLYHISAQSESLVGQFDAFSETLSAATHTLQNFDLTQAELASEMQTRLEELWQLADFYDGFVGAYDALVIEVARRIGVQNRMEKVVEDAKRRLDGLLQEDRDERERFREQWGMWLPVDIWPGLVDGPVRWEWEKREPARPLPKLRRELVEKAVMRGGSARTTGASGGER